MRALLWNTHLHDRRAITSTVQRVAWHANDAPPMLLLTAALHRSNSYEVALHCTDTVVHTFMHMMGMSCNFLGIHAVAANQMAPMQCLPEPSLLCSKKLCPK